MHIKFLCSLLLISLIIDTTQCMQKEKEPRKYQIRFQISQNTKHSLISLTANYLGDLDDSSNAKAQSKKSSIIDFLLKKHCLANSTTESSSTEKDFSIFKLFNNLHILRKKANANINFSLPLEDSCFFDITISTPLSPQLHKIIEQIKANISELFKGESAQCVILPEANATTRLAKTGPLLLKYQEFGEAMP